MRAAVMIGGTDIGIEGGHGQGRDDRSLKAQIAEQPNRRARRYPTGY